MAWEPRKRGQGSYYTRSERDGSGRVVRTYYGNGETARLFAELHRMEIERKEIERADASHERQRFDAIDSLVADACKQVEAAMSETLAAAGYRRHARGRWRKTRQNKRENKGG